MSVMTASLNGLFGGVARARGISRRLMAARVPSLMRSRRESIWRDFTAREVWDE